MTITRRGEPIAKLVAEPTKGAPLDLAWLRAHIVTPKSGTDFDSAALIASA